MREDLRFRNPTHQFPACFQVTHPEIFLRRVSDSWFSQGSHHHPAIAFRHIRRTPHIHPCGRLLRSCLHIPHTCPCKPFRGVIHGVSPRIRVSYRIRAFRPSEVRFRQSSVRGTESPPHDATPTTFPCLLPGDTPRKTLENQREHWLPQDRLRHVGNMRAYMRCAARLGNVGNRTAWSPDSMLALRAWNDEHSAAHYAANHCLARPRSGSGMDWLPLTALRITPRETFAHSRPVISVRGFRMDAGIACMSASPPTQGRRAMLRANRPARMRAADVHNGRAGVVAGGVRSYAWRDGIRYRNPTHLASR